MSKLAKKELPNHLKAAIEVRKKQQQERLDRSIQAPPTEVEGRPNLHVLRLPQSKAVAHKIPATVETVIESYQRGLSRGLLAGLQVALEVLSEVPSIPQKHKERLENFIKLSKENQSGTTKNLE